MRKVWAICLSLYLAIVCVMALTNLEIVAVNVIQAVLAGIAAICLILDK